MRYSVEPRVRIYVKGYGFLSFAKNMGNKIVKNSLMVLKNQNRLNKSCFKKSNSKNCRGNWLFTWPQNCR